MGSPPTATLAVRAWLPRPAVQATAVGPTEPARTVVLVHGITGWSRTWWRVGPAFAERGWRAVAVDLRGHGASPRMEGTATASSLAADLGDTLQVLGLAPVHAIVAHSLGAAVTMELLDARPDIAGWAILEDPPGQSRAADIDYQNRLAAEVAAARTSLDDEVGRQLAENPAWQPEDARQDVEGKAVCDVDGILRYLRANTGARVLDLAPRLTVPALYLLADEARSVLGPRRAELLATLPPGSAAAEFDAGHTIHRDRTDEYVAAALAWLERP